MPQLIAESRRHLRRLQADLRMHDSVGVTRMLALYVTIGVIVGLIAILFHSAVSAAEQLVLGQLLQVAPNVVTPSAPLYALANTSLRHELVLIIPTVGALLAGLLVYFFAPEAAGPGTNAVIEAYHSGARIRRRVAWVKTVASALVLSTGGSAGQEGPIAHVSAAMASVLSGLLKLTLRERHTLVAAAAAAGIGALFHAPVAGALVISEVLYKEMELEHEVLVPALIASIVAYSVYTLQYAWTPLFRMDAMGFASPVELGPYLILALVLAFSARGFTLAYLRLRDRFAASPLPLWLKPAVGGLGVGMVALILPSTLLSDYGLLQHALDQKLSLQVLIALILGKIAATLLTAATGNSGGLLAPCMVIGGLIGGGVGLVTTMLLPELDMHPAVFVVIGMAGFFAAVSNAPLSTIILVTEMTGSYRLLVPAMWVCIIAYVLVRDITIFDGQHRTRFDSRKHLDEAICGVVDRYRVADVVAQLHSPEPEAVRVDTSLRELRRRYATADAAHHGLFPVRDKAGLLVGVVDEETLRVTLLEEGVEDLLVAADLMHDVHAVRPEQPLRAVLDALGHGDRAAVLVLAGGEPGGAMHSTREAGTGEEADGEDGAHQPCRVLAAVSRRDVVAFMDDRVHLV